MAVVHEHPEGDGGSSAAVVAIFLIALIVTLAILFYGFAIAHWFGFGMPAVNPSATSAPSVATSASGSTSASASISASP